MMSKLAVILVVATSLVGCATTKLPVVKTEIQRVEIPVAMPCETEIPTVPEFNFNRLEVDQDLFDKAKAVLADRKLHLGYEEELLTALKSCK